MPRRKTAASPWIADAATNEEDSGYNFPSYRHRRGAVLGLSRPKPAGPDGRGTPERGVSLGSDGDVGLCGGGGSSRVSLARFAESAKDSPQCPAPDRTLFHRDILQPISPRRHGRRHHQKLLPAEGNA